MSDGVLNFDGLLGFDQIDLGVSAPQEAIANAFNKIGELRIKTEPAATSLDVGELLGFEHLEVGATISSEAIAEAFNKIGETRG